MKDILHSYGLKATASRIEVMKVMATSPSALSHHDITSRLSGRNMDKVTLYRILNAFIKCGLAHKVANEERNWLYALHINDQGRLRDTHAHFICISCERIFCLPISNENNKPLIGNINGFVITSHEYRLRGTCPDCN